MSRRVEQLETWIQGASVGRVACSPRNNWTYTYHPSAAAELALTMPREQVTYTHHGILPPLEQHLPEMDLSLFPSGLWKIIRHDDMGMLLLGGNRRLGRVSFAEPGSAPEQSLGLRLGTRDLQAIDDGEAFLADVLSRLTYIPGVSGIQPKTLARIDIGGLESARAHIDTHILKGNRTEYPWATLIESLCLSAARRCGLPAPDCQLSGDGRLLAVKRFDLTPAGDAAIGFDEACSLMGLYAKDKYSGSYEALWKSMGRFIGAEHRVESAERFFRHLTFCYAIENGDAHLKNFGLLYHHPDHANLAPAYDLLTTTGYPGLHRDIPALTLAGRKTWDSFAALAQFGRKNLLLSAPRIRQIYQEIHEGLQSEMPAFDMAMAAYPQAREVLERSREAWQRGMKRIEELGE